ncbi:MAG TPA: hypothetical protein VGK25_13385 [Ignavibacteria bacterium]|jgi:hypothetical protein
MLIKIKILILSITAIITLIIVLSGIIGEILLANAVLFGGWFGGFYPVGIAAKVGVNFTP